MSGERHDVIVVYAGRRPSPEGFPEGNVEQVARRLEQLMSRLRPRLVVGSAAAGADLLALEAAIRVDAQAHVVLAGDQAEFRESSVADVGQDWARRYDALLRHPSIQTEVSPLVRGDSDATYRAATQRIWDVALAARRPGEEIVVVPIAKPRREGVDHTEELVAQQDARGGVVIRIDPTIEEPT